MLFVLGSTMFENFPVDIHQQFERVVSEVVDLSIRIDQMNKRFTTKSQRRLTDSSVRWSWRTTKGKRSVKRLECSLRSS